jgi:hypothetical protein
LKYRGSLSGESGSSDNDWDEEEDQLIIDLGLSSCPGYFSTLSDIEAAKSSIPTHCFDKYILQAMLETMSKALNGYVRVVQNGYDRKFEVYQELVKAQVKENLLQYMRGAQASGNFRCTEHKVIPCCYGCGLPCVETVKKGECNPLKECVDESTVDVPIDCPTSILATVQSGWLGDKPNDITYTLINEDRFWTELFEEYGILKDWVNMVDWPRYVGKGCATMDTECRQRTSVYSYKFPWYNSADIPNPKEAVAESYDNIKYMYDRAVQAQEIAQRDLYFASYSQLVDTISMPALMMAEAVESMEVFASQGEEIEQSRKKAMILSFITAALMIIPLAGRIAGAVGGVAMRGILGVIGETAMVALTIYELVDDPSNALYTVLGLFVGGVSRQPFREAAQIRRGIKPAEMNKMPEKVRTGLSTIDSVRKICVGR